jgi:large subunit ribosomal protein L4
MKVAALRGALSDRARAGVVFVVESFNDGDTPRTKDALAALNEVTDARKVLVVLPSDDRVNWISLRNLPQVHLIDAGQLNTYDVLVNDAVVFLAAALDEFLGVPAVRTEVAKPVKKEKPAKAGKLTKAEKAAADESDSDESDSDEPDSGEPVAEEKPAKAVKTTKAKKAAAADEAEPAGETDETEEGDE